MNPGFSFYANPLAISLASIRKISNLLAKKVGEIILSTMAYRQRLLVSLKSFIIFIYFCGENEAKFLANRFRTDMNVGTDAIVSEVELLESCGVKIIEIDLDDEKFSGTCNTAGIIPVIVINKNMSYFPIFVVLSKRY